MTPEASARASDFAAMERALQDVWPSGYLANVLERMAAARRRAYRIHASAGLPRICPGCGAPHSLAEVCR